MLLLRDHKEEYCVDLSQYTTDEKEEPEIYQRVQDKLPMYTEFMPALSKMLFLYYQDQEGCIVKDGMLIDKEGKEVDIILATLNYVVASCIMQGEARDAAEDTTTHSKLADALQLFADGINLQLCADKKGSHSRSVPRSNLTDLAERVFNHRGKKPSSSKYNRNETYQGTLDKGLAQYTRETDEYTYLVEVREADKIFTRQGNQFTKMLTFSMQHWKEEGYPGRVSFPLDDMVQAGMYSTQANARAGATTFLRQLSSISMKRKLNKNRSWIGSNVITDWGIVNNVVFFDINPSVPNYLLAEFTSELPDWAYDLSPSAFNLLLKITGQARQSGKQIKETGCFDLRVDTVRAFMGLPSPTEVTGRKYKERIKDPIENALEEIEETSLRHRGEWPIQITPTWNEGEDIEAYLAERLVVKLPDSVQQDYVEIAERKVEIQKKPRKPRKKKPAKDTGDQPSD